MSETTSEHEEYAPVPPEDRQQKDMSSPLAPAATRLKRQVTPYLPPPVVAAMKQIDPQLEPFFGPDASITILGTLVIALLAWKLLSLVMGTSSSSTSGGGAIQDEKEDDAIVEYEDVSYDGTVLFCGPPLAGKTSLFYSLVYPSSRSFQTVSSIKPNTGFVTEGGRTWRYLDTPGHWSPQKLVSTVLTNPNSVDRIVVVLDATQPVSKAVDYLYELLKATKKSIVIAGHKSKAPKAKNVRRLKLQVRNELERLGKLDTTSKDSSLDWDDILSSQVGFVSTSVEPPVLEELQAYLQTGTLPTPST